MSFLGKFSQRSHIIKREVNRVLITGTEHIDQLVIIHPILNFIPSGFHG